MDLKAQINSLTDQEAVDCLNRVLVGMYLTQPTFQTLLSSQGESEIAAVIQGAAAHLGQETPPLIEPSAVDRKKFVKEILIDMSDQPETRPNVTGALGANRPTLVVDPITASLVLAGIVALLSADIKIDYRNGKLEVSVHKKPTAERLLAKFFKLF
jgi:hypothetical protein